MSIFTYNGTSYEVISTAKTWVEAKSYAESNNGYLVIITSQAENDAIINNALNYLSGAPSASDGGNAKYVWIGGSDIATEGTFKWVDNSNVSAGFANWGSGFITEPDDFEGQDALAMGLEPWPAGGGGIGTAGKWNDIDENNLMYFVVEYNSTEVIPQESSVTTTLSAETVALKLIGTQKINGTGNALNNTITGNVAANVLSGLAGNDTLDGGLGNDTIIGGAGDDRIYGGAGNDVISTTSGLDWVYGGEDNDKLTGSKDADHLEGDSGNDTVTGGNGDDALWGSQGNDLISGGSGVDYIWGGAGNDTLSGGSGRDRFHFGQDGGVSVSNMDMITDFRNDEIYLYSDVFINQTFISVKLLSDATLGEGLIYEKSTGILYYDADGAGTGDSAIAVVKLIGKPTLSVANFYGDPVG